MTQGLVDFFASATKGASFRQMADRLGMIHTTLAAQLQGDKTPGILVSRLCREYGAPFDEACIAAGWVTEEEAGGFARTAALRELSDLDLSKEMLRRVASGDATTAITDPAPEELIDDVLRSVEDAREQGRRSHYAAAANDGEDNTPGVHDSDDREGL